MGISLWKSVLFFVVMLLAGLFLIPSQRQIGMFYSEARKYTDAMPYLERQYQNNPGDLLSTRRYLKALLTVGQFEKFERLAKDLEREYPREPQLLKELADYYEGVLDYPRASMYWEKILALDARQTDVKEKLIIYYRNYKQLDPLARIYEGELAVQKSADMHYSLAQIYASRHDVPAMIRVYQTTLRRFPQEEIATRKLADLWEYQGRDEEALNLLKKLYLAYPENREYAQRLVEKLLNRGQSQEAVKILVQSVPRFAGRDATLFIFAQYLSRAGEKAKALALLEQINKNFSRPAQQAKLGELYFELDAYERSREILRRLHETTGGTYHSHHVLGDVLAVLGDTGNSRREYERALELIRQ